MESGSTMALLILCVCLLESTMRANAAPASFSPEPQGPEIECGDTPATPVNVTYSGSHVDGIYAMGRRLECYSHRILRNKTLLYIVYNVFGRDCGGTINNDTRSIRVRLQHHYGLIVAGDTVHELTCNYAKQVKVTHAPVGVLDPAVSSTVGSDGSSVHGGDSGSFDDFGLGLFHDDVASDGNGEGGVNFGDADGNRVNFVEDGGWFGDSGGGGNVLTTGATPATLDNYNSFVSDRTDVGDSALRGSDENVEGPTDVPAFPGEGPDLPVDGLDLPGDDLGLPGDDMGLPGDSLDRPDDDLGLPDLLSGDPGLANDDDPNLEGDPGLLSDDSSLAGGSDGLSPAAPFPLDQPGFDPLNPFGSPAQGDAASRVPKTKPPSKKANATSGAMLPSATAAPSVLQLNVIDEDGGLTAVVFPGKPVGLEVHSARNSPFGSPVVRNCRVSNPLDNVNSNTGSGWSATLIDEGCGLGDVLPTSSGFRRGRQGYTVPFFTISPAWAQQGALLVSCDVIICAEIDRCKQTCPPSDDKKMSKGTYDITVTLQSQVVTSCPSSEDIKGVGSEQWSAALLPECFPGGHPLHNPFQTHSETEKNLTDILTSGNDSTVGVRESPTSWLVQHLHYVIIICVLGLLIVVFMCGTFFKMASMHHQVRRSNKKAADPERAAAVTDTHDQTTQTTRPLPRIPSGRGHGHGHGHSRHRGDGSSTAVLQTEEAPRVRPMSDSQLGPLENSLEFSPPLSVSQLEDESRPRAAAEEVTTPPRESVTAQMGTPHVPSPSTPPIFDLSNRLSGVRSFQTTTTVEETNSERHISIIEVKSPSKPPRDWTTTTTQQQHEHNPLGTFTGGNPFGSGGGNTLERERGVVLGVNSLRRHHLDREQQQQQHQVLGSPRYFNTPAPCSEDSTPKEPTSNSLARDHDATAILEHNGYTNTKAGIRTAPHCGGSPRKVGTVVVVNAQEETTRL